MKVQISSEIEYRDEIYAATTSEGITFDELYEKVCEISDDGSPSQAQYDAELSLLLREDRSLKLEDRKVFNLE